MQHLYVLLLMIFIVGCDTNHSLQKHLNEYQARMANIIEAEGPRGFKVSLPPYPKIKDLAQNIPATSIKLFEFYNLKHCELYSLVAARNTSLGNLQLPSTRYIYERHLIDAFQQCITDTSDSRLQEKLINWQQTKLEQLPMVWADLIQLSSEMKQALSANFGLVEGNQQDGLSQTKTALNYLLQLNLNQRVDSAELEQHLQRLMNNPLPAKLWLSQLTLTEHLKRTTDWLMQYADNLQCSTSSSNKKMEYLTNVFQRFFIEKIQPIASQVNHYHYELAPIFQNFRLNPNLSDSFKDYIQQFNQQGFENYQTAMQQHIQLWQELFKRCNIKPGKT